MNAVQQLQYEPNVMARNLVKQKPLQSLLCAFIGQQGEDSLFFHGIQHAECFLKHDFCSC